MITATDMKKVIDEYEKKGIVTRDDFVNLNSRALSYEVFDKLKKQGYEESSMTEAHLDNFSDYSRAIYNTNKFTKREADLYLIQNVLR